MATISVVAAQCEPPALKRKAILQSAKDGLFLQHVDIKGCLLHHPYNEGQGA
jgi:hypothetical protein